MRVLLVEDEPRMARLVRQGLEEDSYAVDTVNNGNMVVNWVRSASYDIVVLDIMLPGMNGLEVCRQLRTLGFRMPVLMLTARDAVRDRVAGLDAGADDYLIKPFAIEELTARIRALCRRDGPSKTTVLQVGDLTLDTSTKRACRGTRPVDALTAKEYVLLETLMRHEDMVLSRTKIADHVWNMDFESDSKLIEVHISHLRKKIDAGESRKLIHTVRGLGYRISADA